MMKNKIKTLLTILSIMIINQYSFSYDVSLIKPNPCQDFFSSLIHPNFIYEVKFRAYTQHPGDSSRILYKIFVEQNGHSLQMDQERFGYANSETSAAINLQNFTYLCHNEKLVIKIEVKSFNGNGIVYTNRGYLIVYKNGRGCKYDALTNGSSQLVTTGFCTFFRSGDCSLSSTNYHIKQYKITFTLNGNFTDSLPELQTSLSLGYNGACPQSQYYWAAKINQTNTQAQFITFVYRVTNILGQDLGFWPCKPEEAAISFQYIKRPVIDYLVQYLNPTYNAGYVFCNLLQGNGNLIYDWRDSSRPAGVQFIPEGNKVRIIRSLSDNLAINESGSQHEAWCKVRNQIGETNWHRIQLNYSNSPVACPIFSSKIENNSIGENSILISSLRNPGRDVHDFYLLMKPTLNDESEIEFSIHEPKAFSTHLDLLEMYKAELNPDEEMAVTSNGEFVTYKSHSIEGTKIFLNQIEDVSEKLIGRNDEVLQLTNGDKINVLSAKVGAVFVVMVVKKPLAKDRVVGTIITSDGYSYDFFSRDNQNIVCIKLGENAVGNFTLDIKQYLELDQIIVTNNLNSSHILKLNMKSAFHTNGNDVQRLLSKQDGKYAAILPKARIDFKFENEINDARKSAYILKSAGRYEHYSRGESTELNEIDNSDLTYKLFNSTPNPFNPLTTIKFKIPEDEFVELIIYDITGKEIIRLVNEFRKSGTHEIVFNGEEFSSGVYMYKLQTINYTETKRMILIK